MIKKQTDRNEKNEQDMGTETTQGTEALGEHYKKTFFQTFLIKSRFVK